MLQHQTGTRSDGHCDKRPSDIITDYRLSQQRSIFTDEMYLTMCRMGLWSFWSRFDINCKESTGK